MEYTEKINCAGKTYLLFDTCIKKILSTKHTGVIKKYCVGRLFVFVHPQAIRSTIWIQ